MVLFKTLKSCLKHIIAMKTKSVEVAPVYMINSLIKLIVSLYIQQKIFRFSPLLVYNAYIQKFY